MGNCERGARVRTSTDTRTSTGTCCSSSIWGALSRKLTFLRKGRCSLLIRQAPFFPWNKHDTP